MLGWHYWKQSRLSCRRCLMCTRMHSVPVCCMSVAKSRCTWWPNFSRRLQQLRRSTTAPNLCRLTRSRQATPTTASNRRPRNLTIGRLYISKFYLRPATKSIVLKLTHLTCCTRLLKLIDTTASSSTASTSLAIMLFHRRPSAVQWSDVLRSACTQNGWIFSFSRSLALFPSILSANYQFFPIFIHHYVTTSGKLKHSLCSSQQQRCAWEWEFPWESHGNEGNFWVTNWNGNGTYVKKSPVLRSNMQCSTDGQRT